VESARQVGHVRTAGRAATLAPLVVAGAAAAGLYGSVIVGLVRQWLTDENSSHGLLLVAAALFVLYRRRSSLRALPADPANAGFLVLALALLVYGVGTLTGDVFILRLSLPFAAGGCVLALLGRAHARAALAPLGLLLLALPLPMVVVTYLTLPLQLIASDVAAEVLDTSGVFVVPQGNLLILKNLTLEVAEACSGLRSLVSLVTVAAVAGAVLSLSAARTVLLMAAAIPIAVIGNGFRVAATGFLATWFGEIAVRGVVHDLTGFAAFLVMCGAIIAVQMAVAAMARRATCRSTAAPRALAVHES
jgi:exosortase